MSLSCDTLGTDCLGEAEKFLRALCEIPDLELRINALLTVSSTQHAGHFVQYNFMNQGKLAF